VEKDGDLGRAVPSSARAGESRVGTELIEVGMSGVRGAEAEVVKTTGGSSTSKSNAEDEEPAGAWRMVVESGGEIAGEKLAEDGTTTWREEGAADNNEATASDEDVETVDWVEVDKAGKVIEEGARASSGAISKVSRGDASGWEADEVDEDAKEIDDEVSETEVDEDEETAVEAGELTRLDGVSEETTQADEVDNVEPLSEARAESMG